jgi:hypothetical protein
MSQVIRYIVIICEVVGAVGGAVIFLHEQGWF